MKCPNCGAEIKNNSKFCEFCGSAISTQMRREQEQLNKAGCPRCGSTNITFSREKQGEVKGKRGTAVVRSTVGVCKDCGCTWQADSDNKAPKKEELGCGFWDGFVFSLYPLQFLCFVKRT